MGKGGECARLPRIALNGVVVYARYDVRHVTDRQPLRQDPAVTEADLVY